LVNGSFQSKQTGSVSQRSSPLSGTGFSGNVGNSFFLEQELNQTDKWIEIPEEVREMYKYYRSTPLVRAYGLEKALGTPDSVPVCTVPVQR